MSLTTLWDVLNNTVPNHTIKRGIEIPMIQRDYAQGRSNNKASEIRKVFLNKLLTVITNVIEGNALPLELDFIYGYVESEQFIPLDGQQRLTTLYLLHWYFAFKDQSLPDFKTPFLRFSYQTRQSSEDFLKRLNDGLTNEDYSDIFTKNKTFKSVITDKNWHFVNWKYDLTIRSAITMLDEIHSVFFNTNIKFSDLICPEKPCIVFNFLNIKTFGLSDDLYIKMNARGKPLTNFENLKAELGKFIELSGFNEKYNYELKHSNGSKHVDVETYFITKIDTTWSDFFWNIRDTDTNEFDDKLLNLLGFISLNELIKGDLPKFDSHIKELGKDEIELSYYKFQSLGLLTEDTIISYINTLDLLVSDSEIVKKYLSDSFYFDKKEVIASSYLKNFEGRYLQRIEFYAMFKFLIANKNSADNEELKKWDRLIRNLAVNTIYNKSKDFQDSIIAIDSLLQNYKGSIYETFLQTDITGFESQQIKEEKLKIILINLSQQWNDFIIETESHPYLSGQIISLLSFSGIYDKYLSNNLDWEEADQLNYLGSINLYFSKFKKLFSNTGLRNFDKELFRRALLVKGDYLLYATNYSLIVDAGRDVSWKRLLKEVGNRSSDWFKKRCGYLKELIDEIEIDSVEDSLKQIINNSECSDWRKDFIEHPMLIEKSKQKYLKFFENEDIYLLRKSKYNKYEDPEVKSILLKSLLLKKGFEDKDIELGYVESLYQYGIVRIKNYKPKVVYNFNDNKQYIIKQKGKDDFLSKSSNTITNYITENF